MVVQDTQDAEIPIGGLEFDAAWRLQEKLIALKEENNGTPSGRLWAIAATDCEKLVAWIVYAMDITNSAVEVTEAAS